jgi:spermidine/putrescine-binding protein
MKTLFKRTSLLVSAVLAVGALTVFAKTSPTFDIHTNVISKAAQSEKGVILVLTERGDIAAEAAYLLLAQVKQNEGYEPLLLAVESDKVAGYRSALGLPNASLPAVIFFNKSGKEIVRVVAAKSAMSKFVQSQDRVS